MTRTGVPPGTIEDLSARYGRMLARAETGPRGPETQSSWGWQIAGYLYLGGLGAGAFAVALVLDWLGLGLAAAGGSSASGWDPSKAAMLWGPLPAGLGASLLILDLGRNRHLFWTAGRNARTSWMARGFSILLTFLVLGCVIAGVAVLAPEWRGAASWWRVVEAAGVTAAVGTALYTGILVRSMARIPAWHSPVVPPLFLASALSTGAMAVFLTASASPLIGTEPHSVERLARGVEVGESVVLVGEGVLVALYLRGLAKGGPEARHAADMLLRGRRRYRFWVGVVGCAVGAPLLLGLSGLFLGARWPGVAAAACVLGGGYALRLAVLSVGVKEPPPLCRFGEWRGGRPRAHGV